MDLLIESGDGDDATRCNGTQRNRLKKRWHNPFTTFSVATELESFDRPSSLEGVRLESESTPVPDQDLLLRPSVSLPLFPDISSGERELFHHYVSHIAEMMVPYKHSRNVWKTEYPAVALSQNTSNQRALYNAIMAQAAFNMAHLRGNEPKLLRSASKYYERALHQLQLQIGIQNGDFLWMLSPIMTLLFAEVSTPDNR